MVLGKDINPYEDRLPIWIAVWTAQVIPKVRIFMWRLIQNIIPSAGNLRGKGIQADANCCVCGHSGETSYHAMFGCTLSQAVWSRIYPSLNVYVQRNAGQDNFLQKMIEMMTRDEVLEVCMVYMLVVME